MLNSVVLVGKIFDISILIKDEYRKYMRKVTIAVPKPNLNKDGVEEVDLIECTLYGNIAENTAELCKKGDVIGVRGRIEKKFNENIVIAEKLTFLSTNKEEEK